MKLFFKGVKAASKAFISSEGTGFTSKGYKVTCTCCGGDRFKSRSAQLNTQEMTLMGLDWLNASATALVCERCGKIEWFADKPTPEE
ncbi:MAG: hypothetical protein Q7Q73_15300 [Verrucomicrobiota bacterium JB024]|nr:hypothetical protein [Verrucomicrobiota bacterium JB024]